MSRKHRPTMGPTGHPHEIGTQYLQGTPSEDRLLIFYLRPARRKARDAATAEALHLLGDLDPSAPRGGPLSEQGGLFWVTLVADKLSPALARIPQLGYTRAVDLLEPVSYNHGEDALPLRSAARLTRWRGRSYRLVRVYEEDPEAMREQAPDRRTFLFETSEGEIRAIRGYRGGRHPLSRRGLPVYDARLLVNLVFRPEGGTLLDPFAGAGGIVLEALKSGWQVVSSDVDRVLRHGLSHLGTHHCVADARNLPFQMASIDSIATEPPYDRQAESIVISSIAEMHRVLKVGGRLAMLCAAWQREGLHSKGTALGLRSYLDTPINRKGLDVALLVMEKEA